MNLPKWGDVVGHKSTRTDATKNVMSPLQWLLPVVLPVSLAAMMYGPAEYRAWFAILFFAAPIFFLSVYTFLLLFDRDRLQTEEHRFNMTQLTYQDSRGIVLEGMTLNTGPPPHIPPPSTPIAPPSGGQP
jgi:hypothetical protein